MHDDNFTKGLRGEFRGDFTRDTFDPLRHFSRVLMQQGRVQLDADWNEQVSISTHYIRTLVTDLIGPHGVPAKPNGTTVPSFEGDGFKIEAAGKTFRILLGHYYVNGILCDNDLDKDTEGILYLNQPDYPLTKNEKERPLEEGNYLVYLDVWERHLSYVEDDYMREKALGSPDTATRAKIVWQVKLIHHNKFEEDITPSEFKKNHEMFLSALTSAKITRPGTGLLRARAQKASKDNKDPCLVSPKAKYRGAENQLYRVEIHKGGESRKEESNESNNKVTFKWSRENGSVIFPIMGISDSGIDVTLEHLGRDCRFGLKPNDWVEIVDDDYILRSRADVLLQVERVDLETLTVTLRTPSEPINKIDLSKHPYLRRWDQKKGDANGVLLREGSGTEDWIELEDGVEIQFLDPSGSDLEEAKAHVYQTGDYWLIPARTATGDVEWPGVIDEPDFMEAQGVDHHYAPLANILVEEGTVNVSDNSDLRRKIIKLWK